MNVCGYVRVSSDGQTENYSIPQQQKAIRSYCKAKGWNLVKMYVDGGYTGANINRPALQELIADIKAYDLVLVFKLDRLSRKQKDTLELSFEDAKKIFKNAKKNFADTFTVEQQRAILHSLIKKIVLQGDEIQIFWRFE